MSPGMRHRIVDVIEVLLLALHMALVVSGMYRLATGWPFMDTSPHAWVMVPINLMGIALGSLSWNQVINQRARGHGGGMLRPHPMLPCVLDRVTHRVKEISSSRFAVRLSPTRVQVFCGECQQGVALSRQDESPFSEADILDALTTWPHTCE